MPLRGVLRRSPSGFAVVALALALAVTEGAHATPRAEPLGLGAAFAPGRKLGGETARRLIHFTFDDGPDARTTPDLLDALDELRMKATFFFSASRFRDGQKRNAHARELALEVKRRGHGIGSHSVDHKRMRSMSPAELRQQLDEGDRLFTEVFGARTHLFRPPWGSHSAALDAMLAQRGDTLVMWNLGMADWVKREPQQLVASFLRRLDQGERERGERGGIVLMHDTHAWSVQAVPLLVSALRARNCKLLDGGEELYDFVDDLAAWGDHGMASPAPSQPAALELAERTQRLRSSETRRCQGLALR